MPTLHGIKEDFPEITLSKIFGVRPRVKTVDFFGSSSGRFLLDTRICDYEKESNGVNPEYSVLLKVEGCPVTHRIPIFMDLHRPSELEPVKKVMPNQKIKVPFIVCPVCKKPRRSLYFSGENFGCSFCFKLYSLEKAVSRFPDRVSLRHLERAKSELEEFRGRNRKYSDTLKKLEMRVRKIQNILSERIEE